MASSLAAVLRQSEAASSRGGPISGDVTSGPQGEAPPAPAPAHEPPHIPSKPTSHGSRSTGTPWVASPFLRWAAGGVAVITFGVIFAYSTPHTDSPGRPDVPESFFAVYMTDDALPAGLESLEVEIGHVWAGCGDERLALGVALPKFDLSAHEGAAEAVLVAWAPHVPVDKQKAICVEFDRAVGKRADELVELEIAERELAVEYAGRPEIEEAAKAVMLDVDLAQTVVEVVEGDGSIRLHFLPTVSDLRVAAVSAEDTVTTAGDSSAVPATDSAGAAAPTYSTDVPAMAFKQHLFAETPSESGFSQYRAPAWTPPTSEPTSGSTTFESEKPDSTEETSKATATDEPMSKTTSSAPGLPTGLPMSASSSSSTTSTGSTTTNGLVTTTSSSTSASGASSDAGNAAPKAPGSPTPSMGATIQPLSLTLSWTGGDPDAGQSVEYFVYLDTANPPQTATSKCKATSTSCTVAGPLNAGTWYYWRVLAVDSLGAFTLGDVWSFRTSQPPTMPANPSPANGAVDVAASTTTISFSGGDPDGQLPTYYVYFGPAGALTLRCTTTATTCEIGSLAASTSYEWRVVSSDGIVATTGATWSFKTKSDGCVPGVGCPSIDV